MKKLFAAVFWLAVLAAAVFGGWFAWSGFHGADEYEQKQSLESLVEVVRSKPDYVPYDQVSPFLYEATIAVEDARYDSHGGLDFKAIVRAAVSQVVPGMPKSGGSTIAQQTVKNLYHVYEGDVQWKAAEMVLAVRLEQMYSKEEILSLYVNVINYGDEHHGIYQASTGYFGILPSQLSEGQASLLAGIPQSPGYYQLSDHFEQAKEKQKVVLQAMVRNHYIDQTKADEIYNQPVYSVYGMKAGQLFEKQINNAADLWQIRPFAFRQRKTVSDLAVVY